jgi:hypothetical protein
MKVIAAPKRTRNQTKSPTNQIYQPAFFYEPIEEKMSQKNKKLESK